MANEASSKQPAIPGYEPIRVLGMNLGTVYLARHSSSGALVALKVLPLDLAGHVRDLYLPLARLHHPNIMRVVEMGEFEEKFFCAMEYVERSLADRVLEGPLSSAEAAQLAHVVCSALQYASDQGVVALSLAPRSIFLTDESVPKIAEFCSRESNGEPRFLEWALTPPECVSSSVGSASEASQVYRVGALMYEMLTATPPFAADHPAAVLYQVLHSMPEPLRQVNPKVARDLEAVCTNCLAKSPEARYASLRELADHLEQFVQSCDGSS